MQGPETNCKRTLIPLCTLCAESWEKDSPGKEWGQKSPGEEQEFPIQGIARPRQPQQNGAKGTRFLTSFSSLLPVFCWTPLRWEVRGCGRFFVVVQNELAFFFFFFWPVSAQYCLCLGEKIVSATSEQSHHLVYHHEVISIRSSSFPKSKMLATTAILHIGNSWGKEKKKWST